MCFGSKAKADNPSDNHNSNSRPVNTSTSKPVSSKLPSDHLALKGLLLPSQQRSEMYNAPSGPPPNHDQYSAPSPSQTQSDYGPPSGPPPAQESYHDWQTAVPDTSLLPPPPSFFKGHQKSDANNSSEPESLQGEGWCVQNPMTPPITFPEAALDAIAKGDIGVIKPRSYQGTLDRPRPGVWAGKTKKSCPDSSIISTIPLYSVMAHSPLRTGRDKVAYYEVRISERVFKLHHTKKRPEVDLAVGFAASPYPTFRLPGWHRGSLAVHGDDGHKFINDTWGGDDFVDKGFKPGETIGLGMRFSSTLPSPNAPMNVEIFLTRNGKLENDLKWNLHEEGDAVQDRTREGLEGLHDLYAVVGVFEETGFEIVFSESEWLYHP